MRFRIIVVYFLVFGLFFSIFPASAAAQVLWTANGVEVCGATDDQENPQIASDGAGGAFITWDDFRSGTTWDIYVQRIDADGNVAAGWPADGVVISAAVNDQIYPEIIADGAGGAIITWGDRRNGANWDVYAQRIDGAGNIAAGWAANGEAVCTAGDDQIELQLTSDGAGGAVITWQDYRSGTDWDIYANRIAANGAIAAGWAANGEVISTAGDEQVLPQIAGDGAGGAVITWQDGRSVTEWDIYAQRIEANGAISAGWAANGEVISTAADDQTDPYITGDGAGGGIITWEDIRSGTTCDVYAQRIEANGAISAGWAADGVVVSSAAGAREDPRITSDANGGAIITWEDERSGVSEDIYAQRISGAGNVQWNANGVPISTTAQTQEDPELAPDGTGGAVITWEDNRNGPNEDIFAQRIDADGIVKWTPNGIPLATGPDVQDDPQIAFGGQGGLAIVTWKDERGADNDIYAQKAGFVVAVIPTLDEWGKIVFIFILIAVGLTKMKRRVRHSTA